MGGREYLKYLHIIWHLMANTHYFGCVMITVELAAGYGLKRKLLMRVKNKHAFLLNGTV